MERLVQVGGDLSEASESTEGVGVSTIEISKTEEGDSLLLKKYGLDIFEHARTYRENTVVIMACRKFVKNFDPERHLKVLPSGAFRLENIEVNPELVWSDILPGNLKFCRVGVLQFDVSLFQDPSKEVTNIVVRDLYFLVVPGVGGATAAAESEDFSFDAANAIRATIMGLVRRCKVAFATQTPETIRLFELSVLDNISLDAQNVHVRFEDGTTGLTGRHGPPFRYALGFVVEAFTVEKKCVKDATSESAASAALAKAISWKGLAVYLCEDVMYHDSSTFDTCEAMLDAFLEGVFSPPDSFPLLVDKCNGSYDLTVGPDTVSSSGTLHVSATLDKFHVSIATQHLRCLAALEEAFSFDVFARLGDIVKHIQPTIVEKDNSIIPQVDEKVTAPESENEHSEDVLKPLLDTNSLLCVTVFEAANLPPSFTALVTEYNDAFVQLKLRRSGVAEDVALQRTRISPKSNHPLWAETFPFEIEADFYRAVAQLDGVSVADSAMQTESEMNNASDQNKKTLTVDRDIGLNISGEAKGGAWKGGEADSTKTVADSEIPNNDSQKSFEIKKAKEMDVSGDIKAVSKVEVDGASQKSIDKNTDNQLKTITANCSLVVELYDHNLFCDALIGSTEINLTEIFSAGQSLKADERVLQLELSSAYARSTKIPPTVTILLSFAPSKKQKSKRKNRPADTFTEPEKSFFELPESKLTILQNAPLLSRPVFESEIGVACKGSGISKQLLHRRVSLTFRAPKYSAAQSYVLWNNKYSSSTIEMRVASINVTFVSIPDNVNVKELKEDMTDTILYRIASPEGCDPAILRIIKRNKKESMQLVLPQLFGMSGESTKEVQSSSIEDDTLAQKPEANVDNTSLTVPAIRVMLERNINESLTLSFGNQSGWGSGWVMRCKDTASTLASLSRMIPDEARIAVLSGCIPPVLEALILSCLHSLGHRKLLTFSGRSSFGSSMVSTKSETARDMASKSETVDTMESNSKITGDNDMSAKFRASERELQHMRRELTNAKKKSASTSTSELNFRKRGPSKK